MLTIDSANRLGDRRLGKRVALLFAFIFTTRRVVMQKTDAWREQMSYYRFINNEKVTEEALIECATEHCATACAGMEEALLIQDTTELNLEAHRGRIRDKGGLGAVGNGQDLGFFCHPTIVVNPRDGALMGTADMRLQAREEERERDEAGQYIKKSKHAREGTPIEEKESYRWIAGSIAAKARLAGVRRVTVVQDREGDIYESFWRLREAGMDFVIRSNHDRKLAGPRGVKEHLKEHLEHMSAAYEYRVEVGGDKRGRQKREALLEVKYGKALLKRPRGLGAEGRRYPAAQEVYIVQARERAATIPAGEEGIEWRLYTSHEVGEQEAAEKILGYYRKRWIIEEVFRALKSEGVNYEASELESGKGLRKLLVMAFMVAIQILQLKQARDGMSDQEASLVFSEEQAECMEDLLPKFEGKTEKQKNPWPSRTLAWASWIIGRLGGWKGYRSQRPPGVITLYEGLTRFHDIFQGWTLAKRCV
jgi:hypothetical protein